MNPLAWVALPWLLLALLLPAGCKKKPTADDVPPPAARPARAWTCACRLASAGGPRAAAGGRDQPR